MPKRAVLTVAIAVFRKELCTLFRNRVSAVALALAAILPAWMCWHADQAVQNTQANRASFAKAERQRWLNQAPTSPHGAAHHGIYVFTPVAAMAAVDSGPALWTGQAIWLEAHKQNFALYPLARDLGLRDGLDERSLAAWVFVVVPLILALLTYASFAGEREDGTLRLSIAMGASPAALVAGKLAATFFILFLLTVPSGIVLAIVSGTGTDLGAALTIFAGYLFQFTALVVVASMILSSRRTALAAALAIWFANTIAVPGALAHAAAFIAPEPSSTDIQAAIIRYTQDRPTLWERREEINGRFLRQYNVKSLTDLPVNPDGILLIEQEREDTAATAGNVERVFAAHRRQHEIYGWGSLLAPSIAAGMLSSAVSGTSLWHFQHFAYAAEAYRRKLVGFLNDATAYEPSIRTGKVHSMAAALDVLADREMWSRAPVFDYHPPDMAASLGPERFRLIAFVAWTVIAADSLVLASRRVGRSV